MDATQGYNDEIVITGAVVIIMISLLFLVLWLICRLLSRVKVKKNSSRYLALLELNRTTKFDDLIREEINFTFNNFDTKAKFERSAHEFGKFLYNHMISDSRFYREILSDINKNREKYEWYKEKIDGLPPLVKREEYSGWIPYPIFNKIENRIIEKNELHPIVDVKFLYTLEYTSPQGRNSYQATHEEGYEETKKRFEAAMKENEEQERIKSTKEYQRRMMNDRLRYDILKRDNFRCVLCGKTAQEGATLEVDHILPVSKGGKTVAENLRTLCKECNRGKSDKYDAETQN